MNNRLKRAIAQFEIELKSVTYEPSPRVELAEAYVVALAAMKDRLAHVNSSGAGKVCNLLELDGQFSWIDREMGRKP